MKNLINYDDIYKDDYDIAKSLNFKNVPPEIIKSISKNPYSSFLYACELSVENVPKEIIKSISIDSFYSFNYAKILNFYKVPKSIIKSILKVYYKNKINIIGGELSFLYHIDKYDKRLSFDKFL